MDADILRAAAAIFGVAGVLVLVASATMRDPAARRALRVLYAVEFLTVGWILVPAWLGPGALAVALVPLAFVAQRELLVLGSTAPGPLEWLAMALGAGIVLVAPRGAPAVGAVWVLGSLGLAAANTLSTTGGVDRLSRTATSLFLPAVCLAHLVWLAALPNGFAWVAFLFGVIECNDSFALLFGKLFGRRRIFPRLSPNKTWAGVVGGGLAGLGAGLLVGARIPGQPPARVAVAALVVVALAVVGDLAASRLKRAAGVKDFGDVLPGHGGVLDTYDTLVFAVPAFFHLLRAVGP